MKHLLIACLMLVGCATTADLPGAGRPAVNTARCLPAGVPPTSEWVSEGGRVESIASVTGQAIPVLHVQWRTRTGTLTTFSILASGELYAIDTQPLNPSTPFWLDMGIATAGEHGVAIRAAPKASCNWKEIPSYSGRPAPRPGSERYEA